MWAAATADAERVEAAEAGPEATENVGSEGEAEEAEAEEEEAEEEEEPEAEKEAEAEGSGFSVR